MSEGSKRWTVRATLNWTIEYLRKQQVDSPRLDAELLLSHALKLRRLDLYLDPDRPLLATELASFKGIVKERVAGRSIAHIIGSKEFYAVRLQTPAGVFVPRPETEELVEKTLSHLPADCTGKLLDLCTGSGAIAISILRERKQMTGDAVELSALGAETALANCEEAGVDDRLTVHQVEAGEFLLKGTSTYDVITCNPPYIPSADIEGLMAEVREYEPREALDGGPDGLDLLRKLLPAIPSRLRPSGFVMIEYDGAHQTPAVRQLLAHAGLTSIVVYKDLAGHDRIVEAAFKEVA
jgi:release factor glutamine methyltransferase